MKQKLENTTTLSRAMAQIAFVEGKKISHKYFLDGEFVKLNADKRMEDENGNILNKLDFWLERGTKQFDDGWFVVEDVCVCKYPVRVAGDRLLEPYCGKCFKDFK